MRIEAGQSAKFIFRSTNYCILEEPPHKGMSIGRILVEAVFIFFSLETGLIYPTGYFLNDRGFQVCMILTLVLKGVIVLHYHNEVM